MMTITIKKNNLIFKFFYYLKYNLIDKIYRQKTLKYFFKRKD